MRKYVLASILFICVVFYFLAYEHEEETRILWVGSECDYVPNNWEEDSPSASNVPLANVRDRYAEGYDIQIAKLVAQSMGAKLEVVKIPWMNLIQALNAKEIDVIFSGMLDTPERKKLISFSEPYEAQNNEYCVMVRKSSKYAGAENFSDLIGATFVAQKDTNCDHAITQIKGAIHLPPLTEVSKIFDKLRNNEADATVFDIDSAKTYERVYPGFKTIRFPKDQGFKFEFSGICAGVRNEDVQLRKEINNALKNISQRDRQRLMDQTIAKSWARAGI